MSPDLEVSVNINATKKSADTFAENIANGLQKSLGKLGMGGAVSVGKGGAVGAGIKEGMAAGLVAGGVVGLLGIVANAIKDLPILVAIGKIFKLILMLLFLPLIPILKPALMLLAEMAKILAPVMKFLSGLIEKLIAFFSGAIGDIAKWIWDMLSKGWDALKNIGKWIFDTIIKPGWEFLKNIGKTIWEEVLKPAWNFLVNVGEKIWTDILKPAFDWLADIGTKIWDILKAPFQWIADKVNELIGRTPKVAANIISSSPGAMGLITTLFGKQLGGPISEEGNYYLHKGERVLSATERGGSSNVSNISFTINNPQIRSDQDIRELVRQIEDRLKSDMRRRVSYGPRNF